MGFGLFGMNFIHGYETKPFAFVAAAGFVGVCGVGGFEFKKSVEKETSQPFSPQKSVCNCKVGLCYLCCSRK